MTEEFSLDDLPCPHCGRIGGAFDLCIVPYDTIKLASEFAQKAHESIDQRRKHSGNPYIEHPVRVAEVVGSTGARFEVIAAAYLHDVVEDVSERNLRQVAVNLKLVQPDYVSRIDCREWRLFVIEQAFGETIADLVEQVTDVSKPSDGNRKVRKQLDLEHLAKASPEAQTIKLADLIDNSRDIIQHDPDFARVYMREKKALLEVLTKGNAGLYAQAKKIVDDYENSLNA